MFFKEIKLIDLLLDAIREVDITSVRELIFEAQEKNINLNVHTKRYVTPLHWAILKCHEHRQDEMLEIMEVLFQANIDVNKSSNDSKRYCPIHTASRRGLSKVVQWLLDHGADPLVKDISNKTQLDFISSALLAQNTGAIEASSLVINRLSTVQKILSLYKQSNPLEHRSMT